MMAGEEPAVPFVLAISLAGGVISLSYAALPALGPEQYTRRLLLHPAVLWAVGLILASCLIAGLGGPHAPTEGLRAVLGNIAEGGALAALYLAGAIGLGALAVPFFRASPERFTLQAGAGLALQMILDHVLGQLGLLHGRAGLVITWCVTGVGLAMLARLAWAWHHRPRLQQTSLLGSAALSLLALPAAAVLAVAACSPPGWLWGSEFGGYDALSYHLQLPQEWLEQGRVTPLTHNVYSYLPSLVEVAFLRLGVMSGAPGPAAEGHAWGLLAGDGWRTIACQLLHAQLALLAAWAVARLTRRLLEEHESPRARAGGILAGALVLATPWTAVVGSLAYNEMAVVFFLAVALIAAFDPSLSAGRKGLLAGLLVGAACGAKPTAIMLAAPAVALVLAVRVPPRAWGALLACGLLAGGAAVAPWLLRNALAGGNPIFPAAASIFGDAHWSGEQVRRFVSAHTFEGGVVDRLRLLALPDPNDPAGPQHRGPMHPQWFLFFPAAVLAAAATIVKKTSRRTGLTLTAATIVQLLAWLLTTHVQSRFLLPLLVPGAALVGLAAASLRPGIWLVGAIVLAQSLWTCRTFWAQNGGRPNQFLTAGPAIFSGELFRDQPLPAAQRRAVLDQLAPEAWCNLGLAPGEGLALVGDATPFYLTLRPLRYATTWDAPVFTPDFPDDLRRLGITHVLVNAAELRRLTRSGWADPGLKPGHIENAVKAFATPVRRWPQTHRTLYKLLPPSP